MFSGGLDSAVAIHLLQRQGLDVEAVYFVLPFYSGLGSDHSEMHTYAQSLHVPLNIIEEGEEFLDMIKHPRFGFGKYVNPCIDCRIHRLKKAKALMEHLGAHFLATGEVIGQRPMSQHRQGLNSIEKHSSLEGLLLRPLCAKLLPPTIPEKKRWVDRGSLLGISGRGRKEQFAYAEKYGIEHATPAGGCILTQKETASRYADLLEHNPEFDVSDFRCIAYGRHFRLSPSFKLIVGRNESENAIIRHNLRETDYQFEMEQTEGPFALGRSRADETTLETAAQIVARYSKEKNKPAASVRLVRGNESRSISVIPCDDTITSRYRV
jgi:tRNA U34 2-thiouridine synthase MnmA/TrmU